MKQLSRRSLRHRSILFLYSFKYVLKNLRNRKRTIIKISILKLTLILIASSFFVALADIFMKVVDVVDSIPDLRSKCIGGGRIEHDPDEKTIKVYGYSQVNPEINEF